FVYEMETEKRIRSLETFENNDYVQFLSSDSKQLIVASVRRPFIEMGIEGIRYPLRETNSLVSLWKIDDAGKLYDLTREYGEMETIKTINNDKGSFILIQWRISQGEPSRKIELWELRNTATLKREWTVTGLGGIACSVDGNRVALRLEPARVIEYDPRSDRTLREISLNEPDAAGLFFFYCVGRVVFVLNYNNLGLND